MAEIGNAFVSIAPSAKGFGRNLDNQVGGQLKSSGKRAGGVFGSAFKASSLAILGGIAIAGKFLGTAFSEARESQKVGAQTAAVIKSTGGAAKISATQIGNLSTAISNKVGIDDEAIQSGANLLLTFTNIRNEAGKGNKVFNQTVRAATDMSVALGTDAKSAALQLGKALNDPTKGVTKLQRSGVTFTDQQKKQIAVLQKSGNVLGAQKIILREVNKEFGGSAAAGATAGDKFKVSFLNFAEAIGTAVLPPIDRLLTKLTPLVITLTNNVAPAVAQVSAFVGGLFAKFQSSEGPSRFGQVMTTIGTILRSYVIPAVSVVASFLVNQFYPALFRIYGVIGTALLPVVRALYTGFQTQILPAVQSAIAKFQTWQPTIAQIGTTLAPVVAVLGRFAAFILGSVVPAILKMDFAIAGRLIGVLVSVVGFFIRGAAASLRLAQAFGVGAGAAISFAAKVQGRIAAAVGAVAALPGQIKSAVAGFGNLLVHAGEELVNGLIRGITSKIGAVRAKMSELASTIKAHLPGSPVKAGPLTSWNNGGAGKRLIELLVYGIDASGRSVDGAMNRIAQRVAKGGKKAKAALLGVAKNLADTMSAAVDDLNSKLQTSSDFAASVRDSFKALGDLGDSTLGSTSTEIITTLRARVAQATQFAALIRGLQASGLNQDSINQLITAGPANGIGPAQALADGGPAAISEVNTLEAQLSSAGQSLGDSTAQVLYSAGIQAAQGLVAGLQSQEDALVKVATKLGKKMAKAVKQELGIKSPSRVFAEIGRNTVAGLQQGLDTFAPSKAGAALGNDLRAGFSAQSLAASAIPTGAAGRGDTWNIYAAEDPEETANRVARRQRAGVY